MILSANSTCFVYKLFSTIGFEHKNDCFGPSKAPDLGGHSSVGIFLNKKKKCSSFNKENQYQQKVTHNRDFSRKYIISPPKISDVVSKPNPFSLMYSLIWYMPYGGRGGVLKRLTFLVRRKRLRASQTEIKPVTNMRWSPGFDSAQAWPEPDVPWFAATEI